MTVVPSTACRTLVFGATGYIGTNLVERLIRDRVAVRAAARNLKVLQARGWDGVELIAADALSPGTLTAALEGIHVAYYLVHSMAAGRGFGLLDRQAADHFALAAQRAKVHRIVYLGGLLPKHPDSEHLVSRRETGERLRAGTVPVTEIRAGIIVGAGSAAYEVIRDLVNHLPLMLTPTWVQSRSSPIALDNLLEYLARVPYIDAAAGKVLDAAGPDFITYEHAMREFGLAVGKKPRIIRVPLLTPKLSSYWLGLTTAVPANIARALIGGLKHDLPADDAELRSLVPQRLLTYRESIASALNAEQRNAVTARWTEGLLMFRDFKQDNSFYAKQATGSATTVASVEAVWDVVTRIGGENGYYYMNMLWTARGAMDWLVGGAGLSKGRRHANELRLGDRIDYWTVLALEPMRRLTLHFGMRGPGSGVLEFAIEPAAVGLTRLTITAYWHPRGVWGLLYWYAMVSAHLFIFKGLAREIARRAENTTA